MRKDSHLTRINFYLRPFKIKKDDKLQKNK